MDSNGRNIHEREGITKVTFRQEKTRLQKITNYFVKNKGGIVIAIVAAACLLLLAEVPQKLFGQKTPGSWLEKPGYSAIVIVNVFPDKDDSKNYRLPAVITRDSDGYILDAFKWPNGGLAEFYDSVCRIDFSRPKVIPGFGLDDKDFGCTTSNQGNQTYYIQLTKEKAQ